MDDEEQIDPIETDLSDKTAADSDSKVDWPEENRRRFLSWSKKPEPPPEPTETETEPDDQDHTGPQGTMASHDYTPGPQGTMSNREDQTLAERIERDRRLDEVMQRDTSGVQEAEGRSEPVLQPEQEQEELPEAPGEPQPDTQEQPTEKEPGPTLSDLLDRADKDIEDRQIDDILDRLSDIETALQSAGLGTDSLPDFLFNEAEDRYNFNYSQWSPDSESTKAGGSKTISSGKTNSNEADLQLYGIENVGSSEYAFPYYDGSDKTLKWFVWDTDTDGPTVFVVDDRGPHLEEITQPRHVVQRDNDDHIVGDHIHADSYG